MRAIQVKNGGLFVEWGISTYRYTARSGWTLSPVLYSTLEWDLSSESPDSYEYLTEGDVRALDTFPALLALHTETAKKLGLPID